MMRLLLQILILDLAIAQNAPSLAPTSLACQSDDPEYENRLVLDNNGVLTLYWSVTEEGLRTRLVKTGGGYASIAYSEDKFMPSSVAVIGTDESEPQLYWLASTNSNGVALMRDQTLLEPEFMYANDQLNVYFTKLLNEEPIPIETTGKDWGVLLWAFSSSSRIIDHGSQNRGALELDWSTCDFKIKNVDPVKSRSIKIHGILLLLAWAYCVPLGTAVAVMKRPFWLRIHQFFQLAALVLTGLGFAIAYRAVEKADGVSHLTYRHSKLGLALISACVLQTLMGILRPHKLNDLGQKTKNRTVFEYFHSFLGYSTAVLATITMLSGIRKAHDLQHISTVFGWNTAVILPICLIVALILAKKATRIIMSTAQEEERSDEKGIEAAKATTIESAKTELIEEEAA